MLVREPARIPWLLKILVPYGLYPCVFSLWLFMVTFFFFWPGHVVVGSNRRCFFSCSALPSPLVVADAAIARVPLPQHV